jgi:RNA polymerase sigma-70 factor (ECF subfamily)
MADPSVRTDPKSWVLEAVERHEQALVVYAARLLGDREAARDVVQDVFLRLCRQEPERVGPHLAEWLFTVCRNRATDLLRRKGRMTSLADEHGQQAASPEPAPGEALELSEEAAHVMALLRGLPESQQEVIRLRFQNGFSYREISGITGHSVTNVGYLMHAGMKTLRARLTGLQARALHPGSLADGHPDSSATPAPRFQARLGWRPE